MTAKEPAMKQALAAGSPAAPVVGVEYYECGGAYHRAAFQGNNPV
jgi:hypothetical protein